MSEKPHHHASNSLLGWLGRQFGFVKKAIETDVKVLPDSNTVYRDCKIDEHPLPGDPNVKLRRTVIDEVIVDRKSPNTETRNSNH